VNIISKVVKSEVGTLKMTEVPRLKKALDFLTSLPPGASELVEVVEKPTYVLEADHVENPEQELLSVNKFD